MIICSKCGKRKGSWWDHYCEICRRAPISGEKALEYEKTYREKDVLTPEQIKSIVGNMTNKKHYTLSIIFYVISLVISYFIINNPTFYFEWWMLLAIPLFALWLTAPIFLGGHEEGNNLTYIILGYIIWVTIQWAIYYFGIGPPEGVGVPHF